MLVGGGKKESVGKAAEPFNGIDRLGKGDVCSVNGKEKKSMRRFGLQGIISEGKVNECRI